MSDPDGHKFNSERSEQGGDIIDDGSSLLPGVHPEAREPFAVYRQQEPHLIRPAASKLARLSAQYDAAALGLRRVTSVQEGSDGILPRGQPIPTKSDGQYGNDGCGQEHTRS